MDSVYELAAQHESLLDSNAMTTPPLAGIRILDCSRLLPGPFCTMLLADLGADVIKVEMNDGSLNSGDYARYMPPISADGNSAQFHALNRGKRSIALDLKKQSDREIFMQLAGTAHVVVESFRPGVMDRLGIGHAQIQEKYPHIILCSISGYGQTGPDRMRPGHDINYLAKAGVLGMMKKPALLPVQVADIAGGAWPAALQIVAAVRKAEQTGIGSVIDVSMTDCSYAMLAMAMAKYNASGEPIDSGQDALSGAYPCYDIYPCKDGFFTIGALEPKFWKALVVALGLPELSDGAMAQGADGERVRAVLTVRLRQQTRTELMDLFKNVDTCVEPVWSPHDVTQRDLHLCSREVDIEINVGDGERLLVPKTPLRMTGVVHSAERGPALGEHTQQILDELEQQKSLNLSVNDQQSIFNPGTSSGLSLDVDSSWTLASRL